MGMKIVVNNIEDLNEVLQVGRMGVSLACVTVGDQGESLVELLAQELPKKDSAFVRHLLSGSIFARDTWMQQLVCDQMHVVIKSTQVCTELFQGICYAGCYQSRQTGFGAPDEWQDEVFDSWLSVLSQRLGLTEPDDVKYPLLVDEAD